MSPSQFIHKWKSSELKERSAYQEHFLDLCTLVAHPTPAEMDPSGTNFTFEAGAEKSGGGSGWADVWKRGFFAWEYKGKHKDLRAAYQQLLQYRESLLNPPLLVVCDFDQIIVHTNFTNTLKREVVVTLDDLATSDGLNRIRAIFTDPDSFRTDRTTEQATEEAAREFARLADMLRADGTEPHTAAHFLIRLLFCLFAEDINLLPKGLFTDLVKTSRLSPGTFVIRLRDLFTTMATGGWFGRDQIPCFNGGLFNDNAVLTLPTDGMDVLSRICDLDWAGIEPSIFGTLFERSLDPTKRAQLGAHYTGPQDILLIVEPVLMEPLRAEWAQVKQQAEGLQSERETAKSERIRQNRFDDISGLLRGFALRLAEVRVLDAACGSGNFLYVALRALLDLEKEVITEAGRYGIPSFFPSVAPRQLYGIEVNDYAFELAQATIWIGWIQWLNDNGFGRPAEPILQQLHTMRNSDAIMEIAADGTPQLPDWPTVDVIIGNPPFLGDKKLKRELGEGYVNALRKLYGNEVPGQADLVCYWFYRAAQQIASGKASRAGLIATNSIRNGKNREVLERITKQGGIFMAHSDRPWTLDGAAVRVSIIGFDNGTQTARTLDGNPVATINADVTSAVDLTTAQPLPENEGIAFLGMMKAGPFDIEASVAEAMVQQRGNPNGRPNSDVVKHRINGRDVTQRPSGGWVIDFGVRMPIEQAAEYEAPFEYVRKHVKPLRDANNRKSLREWWWIFGESRPGLRRAIASLSRCIVTPEVSKHRIFVWMPTTTVPDHKLHVIARDDDYFFGVLHSRFHELWSLSVGSWMGVGNDPIYNSSRTFGMFPMPWPPGTELTDDPRVIAIADAARELAAKRDRWLHPPDADPTELTKRTLTNLYNARPAWLQHLHSRLDTAVATAYGWPLELSEQEILERLLVLNKERRE